MLLCFGFLVTAAEVLKINIKSRSEINILYLLTAGPYACLWHYSLADCCVLLMPCIQYEQPVPVRRLR